MCSTRLGFSLPKRAGLRQGRLEAFTTRCPRGRENSWWSRRRPSFGAWPRLYTPQKRICPRFGYPISPRSECPVGRSRRLSVLCVDEQGARFALGFHSQGSNLRPIDAMLDAQVVLVVPRRASRALRRPCARERSWDRRIAFRRPGLGFRVARGALRRESVRGRRPRLLRALSRWLHRSSGDELGHVTASAHASEGSGRWAGTLRPLCTWQRCTTWWIP